MKGLFIILIAFGLPKTYTQVKTQKEIAFVTNRDGNSEIYLMDNKGENLRNITNNKFLDFSPSWNPNGKGLFFYSKRDGNAEIYSMRTDGKNILRHTYHPSTDVLPSLSPDGKHVVFMSERDSISRNVFIMNFDGSNLKQLTRNELYEESPDWSPDGKQIIFTRQLQDSTETSHVANGEIHIMDSDGKNVKRLTFKDGYDSGAKFSSDGKKIAFYGVHNKQWDIYIMDSDGKNVYNLTDDTIECYSPDWSPNNEWIVYTAGAKGNYNIWKINVTTKERIQLTNTPGRNEEPVWKK